MSEYDQVRAQRRGEALKPLPAESALLTEDEIKGIAYAESINRLREAHERAAWSPHTVFRR
jgi:hypothetical protein